MPLVDKVDFDINNAIRQVKGTLEIEGCIIKLKEEELIKARVLGEISEEKFIRRAIELANE